MNRRDILRLITSTPAFAMPMLLRADEQSFKRVILVELAGANDGLNTLIPTLDDNYFRLRPTLAVKAPQRIDLNDGLAIHHSLKALMPVWEQRQLAWIQGLGYPQPNRSHFKSISLWETGSDGNSQRRNGWLTHAIEHQLGRNIHDPHGISMVENLNVFASGSGRWMSMTSPEQFLKTTLPATDDATEINRSMSAVKRRIAELELSLHGITQKMQTNPPGANIRGTELGPQLQQVIRMIRAGFDTPVYRIQLSGFDTHEYQQDRHSHLLEQLAMALRGFQQALQADGEWNNTVIMTYSEFGRRAAENHSAGTDHGTAAPHLVMGGAVRGGIYSESPSLEGLGKQDDPVHTMDYRSLYCAILEGWFNINNHTFRQFRDSRLQQLFS